MGYTKIVQNQLLVLRKFYMMSQFCEQTLGNNYGGRCCNTCTLRQLHMAASG